MGLLRKLLSGARKGRPHRTVELGMTDPGSDFPDIIYWASSGSDLRITVPATRLRTWGAFGFSGGWNPMMLAEEDDFETFRAFFRLFQPHDLSDMYFLNEAFGAAGAGPMDLPWLARRADGAERARSAGAVQERRFFGPSSPATIEKQFRRTRQVTRSIRQKGYRPERYGDIQGYFLRLDGDYRFVVRGGKHRATALAHLGFDAVPVRLRPGWPRVVDGDRVREWPSVRRGAVSEEYALAVMQRFFEFDGTQQRDRIFGASREASVRAAG